MRDLRSCLFSQTLSQPSHTIIKVRARLSDCLPLVSSHVTIPTLNLQSSMFWSKRDNPTSPSAYSIPGTKRWLNDDGSWSTFLLNVGTGYDGSQEFSAVVSTSSPGTWLPNSSGCTLNGTAFNADPAPLKPTDCPPSRGIGLYDGQQSTGYNVSNSESAQRVGAVIPSSFNPDYSSESALLYMDQLQMPSLRAVTAPIYSNPSLSPLLATLGIGPGASQLGSNFSISLLDRLNQSDTISRSSWVYTAGAKYG